MHHLAAANRVTATEAAPARGRLGRGRTWILVTADLGALTLAYAASYAVSDRIAPLPPVSAPAWFLAALAVAAVPVWVAVFTAYGLYENDSRRISVASFDEVGDVFHAILAGSLGFLIVSQAVRHVFGWWVYTAVEAFLFLAAALLLVPLVRGSIRSWVFPRLMRRRRAVIVGGGPEAELVVRKLEAHPEYGLDVVATLDGEGDLARVLDELEPDRVLLAAPAADQDELLELLRNVRRSDVQVSIVPRYCDIFTSHAILDEIEGVPVVSLPPMRLGKASRVLKRGFDVAVSSLLLVAISPLLALIALAIRLDSRGAAIFRQPRRGRDGSTFRMLKFRTMRVDAEAHRFDADVLHLNEVDGPLFKVKGRDPRVTRVGGFLRPTSLDELPQLWNVLRGEMSLVGPRPFVIYEADQITGWASRRLDMTPGITGLWQVLGRNDIPFDEMVKLDYLYVTNWSLWWDLKILCQTIPVVVGRRGAY